MFLTSLYIISLDFRFVPRCVAKFLKPVLLIATVQISKRNKALQLDMITLRNHTLRLYITWLTKTLSILHTIIFLVYSSMTSGALISKIHWKLSANQKRDNEFNVPYLFTYKAHSVTRRTLNFRRRLWQVSKRKISHKYPVIRRTRNYVKFCWPRSLYLQQFASKALILKTKAKKLHITNNSKKVTHFN